MKGLERKSVKRRIALLLSCVMLLMSALTGMAAEPPYHQDENGVWVDDNNEVVRDDWIQQGSDWYFADAEGRTVTDSWICNGDKWSFVGSDGKMIADRTISIDGKDYEFNKNGYLSEKSDPPTSGKILYIPHWVLLEDGTWNYYDENNEMVRDEWAESNGIMYYLGADGAMVTDDFVREPNGDVYYVDEQGVRVTKSWRQDNNGDWYYFGKDGRAVRNGWKEIEEQSGTHRYHFDEDGVMSVNEWISDENGSCFVDENGFLVTDAVLPYNGKMVCVGADGYIDWSYTGEKPAGGVTYTFENGQVAEAAVATPSNAESVDDLLETLEQMNRDGASDSSELKQEVADALLVGARDQAEDLDEETIAKLEDALLKAYNTVEIESYVVASSSDADPEPVTVKATGLLLASGLKPEEAKNVKIELQVEQATPSTAEKVVFDVKLLVDGEETPLKTPVYLSVKLPEVFASEYNTEKYTYKVTHTHGDGNKDTETANIKETEEGLILYLRAVSFSEFELTATLKNTSSGSSTGGGSSVSSSAATGKWVKAADGIRWWYQNPDGTWPAGGWAQLPWNGKTDWYYFDAEGYMVTGWITWEGNRYYLHPVADGTQGHMYTGWNEIGGQYYYFRPESGGPQGSLFVNGTTPDGYKVDANGVWIQ